MKNSEKPKNPLVYMYAVQDIVAGRFFPPFTMENDQMAVRAFSQMVNDDNRQNQIAMTPGDFRLFKLADFDPADGQIDSHAPLHLVNAVDVLKTKTKSVVPKNSYDFVPSSEEDFHNELNNALKNNDAQERVDAINQIREEKQNEKVKA